MRVLFLNPNSSEAITKSFEQAIAQHIQPQCQFEVRRTPDAPTVISSDEENLASETLLLASIPPLLDHYDKVVLMSSVDTGFETLAPLAPDTVVGFTRAVLQHHINQAQPLQLITFDPAMTPLYQRIIDELHAAPPLIMNHEVLAIAPNAVANQEAQTLQQLKRLCTDMTKRYTSPIFIVGAVGIRFADQLRTHHGWPIVDPIHDLLAYLGLLKTSV